LTNGHGETKKDPLCGSDTVSKGHLHEKTLPSTLMIKYMNVGWDINHALNCL